MQTFVIAAAAALVAGLLVGFVLRERGRAAVGALSAELEAERRFGQERRALSERSEALLVQVASLTDTHRDLRAQTQHLIDTLKSPVVRGQWGEMQLRRVCELAQMTEHIDFVLQESTSDGDRRLRPDLKVLLPGARSVIVDAKAPLEAFLEALEAPDEHTQTTALRRHARQVRDHIERLSAKAYWAQFSDTPEFVVMFLPGEALFSTALQYDATLIEFGAQSRIILASPTTLIALLRTVAFGWQRAAVSQSADEIHAAGTELHGRLRGFATHLDGVRTGLERAVDSYNLAVGTMEQRVIPQARRLEQLGSTSGDALEDAEPVVRALRRPSGVAAPDAVL